jgi:predicted  nucleic acid-binding Zn-ribbon protein
MQTIQDAITILTAQQKPLAEKLKTLETNYKAERATITAQLQPISKALKTLTPKTPKAPKPEKPAKADKEAKGGK